VRAEIERRYGDRVSVLYHDTAKADVQAEFADALRSIQDADLLYPVTVIDGHALYDGAVSYPAILRAVEAKLA
jgi:disulfide oxidoreductase YuzD